MSSFEVKDDISDSFSDIFRFSQPIEPSIHRSKSMLLFQYIYSLIWLRKNTCFDSTQVATEYLKQYKSHVSLKHTIENDVINMSSFKTTQYLTSYKIDDTLTKYHKSNRLSRISTYPFLYHCFIVGDRYHWSTSHWFTMSDTWL